jgi:hypothetical protein
MQLQIKPTRWTCVATAFAMALDVPVQAVFDEIGHDGSDILFADLQEPMRRRGHHIQECIWAALRLGHSVTPVELVPQIASDAGAFPLLDNCWPRFLSYLDRFQGVITGRNSRCWHAVAFNRGHIYDPDGAEYPFSPAACESRGFYCHCLWIVDRMETE